MALIENSKTIFIKTLNLQKATRYPVAPHWWGIYKYEALGLDFRKAIWQEGEKIADIYRKFYEKFKPDWFHLHIGTPAYFKNSEVIKKENKSYLVIDPTLRALKKEDKYLSTNSSDDEEIVDFPDYLLGSRCFKPKVDLSSKTKIDEFMKRYIYMTAEEIDKLGYMEHVKIISGLYGDSVFIMGHIPSAVCEIFDPFTGYTGFEQGLIAFHDYPEGMKYLLEKSYEAQFEWAIAYAKAGAHAYAISEGYISPDLVNPNIYRQFLKGIHKDYFAEVKKLGLYPVCYFMGDVNPIIDDLAEVNIQGLMVEESKKNFHLDVKAIREKIGDRVCIFGNLDSIYLLREGSPKEIENEVIRQAEDAKNNFIICNGSPVAPGTPKINLESFINTGKALKW